MRGSTRSAARAKSPTVRCSGADRGVLEVTATVVDVGDVHHAEGIDGEAAVTAHVTGAVYDARAEVGAARRLGEVAQVLQAVVEGADVHPAAAVDRDRVEAAGEARLVGGGQAARAVGG